MAKPINALPTWADDSNGGNYTGGPYAGMPRKVSIPSAIAAEGLRPGADHPSAAEHVNDWLNQLSKWITWVFDGTNTAAESAHLVETNALGRIQAQWGSFFASTAPAPYSLSSQAPTDSGNAIVLYAEDPNTDALISAAHDNLGAFGVFEGGRGLTLTCHGNNNDGLEVTTDGDLARGLDVVTAGDGADAVHAVATGSAVNALYGQVNAVLAYAVQGVALDNGHGARFTGGQLSGFGLQAEGKAAEGISCTGGTGPTVPALRATGKLDAPGAIFQGGPTGADGVQGIGVGVNAAGIRGEAPRNGVIGRALSGLATAFGALGVADGLATGVGAVGVDGAAVKADTTLGTGKAVVGASGSGTAGDFTSSAGTGVSGVSSGNGVGGFFSAFGTRPTVRLDPRSSNPATILEGGLWSRADRGLLAHIAKNGGAAVARHLFDTAGGMCFAAVFDNGPDTIDVQTTIVNATMSGNDAPVDVGRVLIVAAVEVGRQSGTPNVRFQIVDETAGVDVNLNITQQEHQLFQTAGADVYERYLVFVGVYTLPSAGSRTFSMKLTSLPGGDGVNWKNAGLVVLGTL